MINWTDVVSTVCAVLAILGAGWSWLHANKSLKARLAAEVAEERAARTLKAVEAVADALTNQASSVGAIADRLREPPLTATWVGGTQIQLRNTTDNELTIREVANPEPFARLFATPLTIPPRGSVTCRLLVRNGHSHPGDLVLHVEHHPQPFVVRLGARTHGHP
ncbi:MAG: hypothetical protein QM630_01115 [Microbacterium sp.]